MATTLHSLGHRGKRRNTLNGRIFGAGSTSTAYRAGKGFTSYVSQALPYRDAITSSEFMSMVMVHPEVPRNSNGAGLGPRR